MISKELAKLIQQHTDIDLEQDKKLDKHLEFILLAEKRMKINTEEWDIHDITNMTLIVNSKLMDEIETRVLLGFTSNNTVEILIGRFIEEPKTNEEILKLYNVLNELNKSYFITSFFYEEGRVLVKTGCPDDDIEVVLNAFISALKCYEGTILHIEDLY